MIESEPLAAEKGELERANRIVTGGGTSKRASVRVGLSTKISLSLTCGPGEHLKRNRISPVTRNYGRMASYFIPGICQGRGSTVRSRPRKDV